MTAIAPQIAGAGTSPQSQRASAERDVKSPWPKPQTTFTGTLAKLAKTDEAKCCAANVDISEAGEEEPEVARLETLQADIDDTSEVEMPDLDSCTVDEDVLSPELTENIASGPAPAHPEAKPAVEVQVLPDAIAIATGALSQTYAEEGLPTEMHSSVITATAPDQSSLTQMKELETHAQRLSAAPAHGRDIPEFAMDARQASKLSSRENQHHAVRSDIKGHLEKNVPAPANEPAPAHKIGSAPQMQATTPHAANDIRHDALPAAVSFSSPGHLEHIEWSIPLDLPADTGKLTPLESLPHLPSGFSVVNERFAPTQTSPIAPALAHSNQLALSDALISLKDDGARIDVTLSPEELGRVTLKLETGSAGHNLTVMVDRVETAELVKRHMQELSEQLADLGYDSLSFAFGSNDDGTSSSREHSSVSSLSEDFQAQPKTIHIGSLSSGLDIRI